jgi:predicted RNA-binding protein
MRKLLLVALVLVCVSTLATGASNSAEYFEGKWSVMIKGTPQGDATIPMRFETIEGATKGYFVVDDSGQELEMSSVAIIDGVLSAAFNITGYDVDIYMSEVDDENAAGSLMGMFDLSATRVKD